MASPLKFNVLREMEERYGRTHKLAGSQSLYDVGDGALRIYFRYSAVHFGTRAFFGLRAEDLRQLEGHPSVICLLWDGQERPLYLPFSEYEEVFHAIQPASDGQYKVQLYFTAQATELYLPRSGRFNVDGYFGWHVVEELVDSSRIQRVPSLSHSQVQALLGAIGSLKLFDVWVPMTDRNRLDFSIGSPVSCCDELPQGLKSVSSVLPEIDVIWIERGSARLRALFEVEHSTPIYSGLLRFNDIHLVAPSLQATFAIVANDERRATFIQQLSRPTFKASGLSDLCTFMRYENVFSWYQRARAAGPGLT